MKPLITWLHFVKMGQILDLIFWEFHQVVNWMILAQSPGWHNKTSGLDSQRGEEAGWLEGVLSQAQPRSCKFFSDLTCFHTVSNIQYMELQKCTNNSSSYVQLASPPWWSGTGSAWLCSRVFELNLLKCRYSLQIEKELFTLLVAVVGEPLVQWCLSYQS